MTENNSINAWEARAAHEITLPSGQVVKIRNTTFEQIVNSKFMPADLRVESMRSAKRAHLMKRLGEFEELPEVDKDALTPGELKAREALEAQHEKKREAYELEELSLLADQAEDLVAMTNANISINSHVIARMLVSPAITPDDVDVLPDEDVIALLLIAQRAKKISDYQPSATPEPSPAPEAVDTPEIGEAAE